MIGIGVQTKNVVYDEDPYKGFRMLKKQDLIAAILA